MSSDPSEVSGDTVRYTVKEILAEIREGISAIKSVSAQHELRLQRVEFQVAEHGMQLGTAAPQIAQLAKIIETQAEVKSALEMANQNAQQSAESAFNRRDKVLITGCTAVLLVLNALALFLH